MKANSKRFVVDTCVLIDIAIYDKKFGERSAACLNKLSSKGLLVCPVTQVELAPVFDGNSTELLEFFNVSSIDFTQEFSAKIWARAAQAWAEYVSKRRHSPSLSKRPVADILIGAFASHYGALVTRNPKDFRVYFPELELIEPK